jgi:hypothetical protein
MLRDSLGTEALQRPKTRLARSGSTELAEVLALPQARVGAAVR